MTMAAKRAKVQEEPGRTQIADLHQALVESFKDFGPEFLWDAGGRFHLVWPSLEERRSYFYIGRQKAQRLYEKVTELAPYQVLQILGAKGSGKSTVMAAIAGYLHGSGTRVVYYVSGYNYVEDPFSVLKDALLLAWWGKEVEVQQLLDLQDMNALQEWSRGKGGAVFVVDDWDKVELDATAKLALRRASRSNMLVRISSVNSRERYAYDTSQKRDDYIGTFEFDGPFTTAELETWIAHSSLPAERLALLDYYTGGMPRLSRFYSESTDDASYRNMIQSNITNRVHSEIVEQLTDKNKVIDALELVTSHYGLPIPGPLANMKLSCLYKEGSYCYRILCSYLRTVAEQAIVSQGALLQSKVLLGDIQIWKAAVQADIDAGRNPARIGWNVEALFIGVLRVQGQINKDYPFAQYKTYAHGKEIDALRKLDEKELSGGVLLGPEAFNEKAVDIVYIVLRDGKIKLIGVQVTVAQWKAREDKNSHGTWRTIVLPNWLQGLGQHQRVEQEFWYAMPQGVELKDVPSVEVKTFSSFCSVLSFLDGLTLSAPKKMEKKLIRTCSGSTRSSMSCRSTSNCIAGCKDVCRCKWFCYHHNK